MEISGRIVFPFVITIATLSGCAMFNPNRQFWVYGESPKAQVRLVIDTPEVRNFLAEPDARQDMTNAPGFYVPAKSYCVIVQNSHAKCVSKPVYTEFYKLVRITSGPSKGKEGWLCGPTQLYGD